MKKSLANISVFVLIALIYTVFEYFTPSQLDNFLFNRTYMDNSGGSPGFSLRAWIDFVCEIRLYDNMRLGNALSPITDMMMPHWLFSLMTGLAVAAIVAIGAQVAARGIYKGRVVPMALLWLGCTVLLPWRNHILVNDFAMNYIYGSLAAMAFAWYMVVYFGHGKVGWGMFALGLLLAALLGAWHEGFALPIACGIGAWMLLRRLRTGWQSFALLAVLLLATFLVFLCPGMLARVGFQKPLYGMSLFQIILGVGPTVVLWLIIAVSAIVPSLRKYFRTWSGDCATVLFAVASLAGGVLFMAIAISVRTSFAPILFSLIALGRMFMPWIASWPRIAKGITAGSCISMCVAHFALTMPWMLRFERQFYEIYDVISEDRGGAPIYYDMIMPEDVPLYTLRFPMSVSYLQDFGYHVLDGYFGRPVSPVLPTALRGDISTDPGEPIGRVMRRGDAIYANVDNENSQMDRCDNFFTEVTLKDGRRLWTQIFYIRFTDDTGVDRYYIKPYNIKAADVVDLAF